MTAVMGAIETDGIETDGIDGGTDAIAAMLPGFQTYVSCPTSN
jgi:hypothetical protein